MAKSRTSRPPQSAERKEHATERAWSNILNMWHVCANAACRRARCCRGSPSYCYKHNYPPLPEGVKDWFFLIGEAQKDGIAFDAAWEELGKRGLVDELANWHDLAHGKRGASGAVT
jgi:hypothetical protein